MCQVGAGKTIAVDVSKFTRLASEPKCLSNFGMSLAGARLLARWCPAFRRREPGQAAFVRNGRERAPIQLSLVWTAIGSVPSGRNREGLSTVAGCAVGLTHSSDEAPVMGVERRGQVIRGVFVRSTGR
jgi:hypothetical protein